METEARAATRGASTEQARGLVLLPGGKQRCNKGTSTDGREQEVEMTSEGFTEADGKSLMQEAAERKNYPPLAAPARVFHLFPPVSIRA